MLDLRASIAEAVEPALRVTRKQPQEVHMVGVGVSLQQSGWTSAAVICTVCHSSESALGVTLMLIDLVLPGDSASRQGAHGIAVRGCGVWAYGPVLVGAIAGGSLHTRPALRRPRRQHNRPRRHRDRDAGACRGTCDGDHLGGPCEWFPTASTGWR